jgi:hypothetical protein
MNNVRTFTQFIAEADEEKVAKGDKAPAAEEKPSIDKDKERLKEFVINGTTYEGVLSTFSAIADKQKAMGEAEVGVISLPGDESAYELFKKEEKKEEEEEPENDEEL